MRQHHRDRRSSTTRPGVVGPAPLLTLAAACLIASASLADDPPEGPVLRTADGGFVAGTLGRSRDPGLLRWHGAAFDGPFDFRLDAVESVRWPAPDARPDPAGADCVELTTDDVLFGTLVGLDDAGATLETPDLGRLRIDRAALRRIDRRRGEAAPVYFGPNGLSEWVATPGTQAWDDEAGHLLTSTGGAEIRLDAGLPPRAAVEVELSWDRKPSFILALGVGDDEESFRHAFRFEVWGPDLVALRETAGEADIAWIGRLDDGPGRVRLRAFLDQEAGRLDVGATADVAPGRVALGGPDDRPLPGIRLTNVRGDVRLERLIVRRWDGTPPPDPPPDTPCLVRVDGSMVVGSPARYDPDGDAFVVIPRDGDDDGEAVVPADRASVLVFSSSKAEAPRDVVLACHDGRRLGGTLREAGSEAIALEVPGIDGPLSVPIAALQSLNVPARVEPEPGDGPRPGTIELDGVRLRGRLAELPSAADETSGRLAWQPLGSATAGPLPPDVSGRIVYKEAPPPRAAVADARTANINGGRVVIREGARVIVMDQQRLVIGADGRVIRTEPTPAASAIGSAGPMLALRSGDVIPADVTAIDEEGVHFESKFSEHAFVPHDRIEAVSFAPVEGPSAELSGPERDALLTLPRMQRGNPPTHLIRSRNGDYLRARLAGLDFHWLRAEVRLAERRLPRAVLSEIRWLHPEDDDGADPNPPAGADGAPDGLRVLAIRGDGVRLSFAADRVGDDTLIGRSDALGTCRVPLAEVDRLVLGAAIDREAAPPEAESWALRDAPDPQFARSDNAGGGPAGTESAMVGAPAPEFELPGLDGAPFRLADRRGEVVILDFWATWCGPCLQAMPQVERLADEFRDRGVRLVAVNLQEGPEQIRATLERHQLEVPVVLDRDGAVAARYGVSAIPQTVIVDRDGTVARLFVGGGPRLGDQLRDALTTLVPGDEPSEDTDADVFSDAP